MRRLFVAIAVSLCLLGSGSAVSAAAYNPYDQLCRQTAASSSDVCHTNGSDPVTGNNGVLRKVSSIIALIAGIAAVIIIIVSAIQLVTSGGNAQQASTARLALIGALVGLIIIMVAQSIILLVLSRVK